MKNFLKTRACKIVDTGGREVFLRGVNLGGWLLMEGYILHSTNIAEQIYKKDFAGKLGEKELCCFEKTFRDNFIRESDIATIARLGFNCLRVPFHYRLIEKAPFVYDAKGLKYLDNLIRWAKKNHIWVILDLHAAVGAQNHDWHSDSVGPAELWTNESFQKRTCALWKFLAGRYKNETALAGYDILNEPVLESPKILNDFYKKLIKCIREVDPNHMIFVEGRQWAMDIACLQNFDDDNLVLSIHAYQPMDFTFNLVPHMSYPIRCRVKPWDRKILKEYLAPYQALSLKRKRPIFVGEFGVNYRRGFDGEHLWVKDIVSVFKEFGFSWSYWTYKAVKNNIFPDGIFSYMHNPPWVNRQGPAGGLSTYPLHWCRYKKEMKASWQTEHFQANTEIIRTFKNALK